MARNKKSTQRMSKGRNKLEKKREKEKEQKMR